MLEYTENEVCLHRFYKDKSLEKSFEKDNTYLKSAFEEIKKLWMANIAKMAQVKYLLIAEAPLWGNEKKYIYNPRTNNSQFFYRSDLGDILDRRLSNKQEFLDCCIEIGLSIVDISPFALSQAHTKINYRNMPVNDYRRLVGETVPFYFERKIQMAGDKASGNIQCFFRYSKVKNTFNDIIGNVLLKNKLITSLNRIGDIAQNGGGIDKRKLSRFIINGNL